VSKPRKKPAPRRTGPPPRRPRAARPPARRQRRPALRQAGLRRAPAILAVAAVALLLLLAATRVATLLGGGEERVATSAGPAGPAAPTATLRPEPPPLVTLAPAARPEPGASTAARPAAPATPPPAAASPAPPTVEARAAPASPPPPEAGPPAPPPQPLAVPAPMLAVIIDDVGPDRGAARALARLEGPLTLSYLGYAPHLPPVVAAARERGHEIFLHLGMEPLGHADPGPRALLAGLPAAELRARTAWAIGRVPGATGVNNHMGSRLTADPAAMRVVMDEIARHGLVFVDSRTTARSVAEAVALEQGLPAAGRDVFLDNERTEAAIRRQLDQAERIARRAGTAIAIGHPYPETIRALARWLPQARARGLRLVPASAVVALRHCAVVGPGTGCGADLAAATGRLATP
jgi:polysaccharide deacetylase 2 family uncharacterized protein YibQ